MRVRVFEAVSEAEALTQARAYFGAEVVIVSSRAASVPGKFRVVAALDESDQFTTDGQQIIYVGGKNTGDDVTDAGNGECAAPPSSPPAPNQPEADGMWRRMQSSHHLSDRLVRRMREFSDTLVKDTVGTGMVTSEPSHGILKATLEAVFNFLPFAVLGRSAPVALVGPPGCGKTLTTAKLLVEAFVAQRLVRAVSIDTIRAGGYEQLLAFTDLMNIPLYRVEDAETLNELIGDAPIDEFAVVDCMSAHPKDPHAMRQLTDFLAKAEIEPILVLPADVSVHFASRVAMAYRGIGCRRVIITRSDLGCGLGDILGAIDANNLVLTGITDSELVTEGFHPLHPDMLATLLAQNPLVAVDSPGNDSKDARQSVTADRGRCYETAVADAHSGSSLHHLPTRPRIRPVAVPEQPAMPRPSRYEAAIDSGSGHHPPHHTHGGVTRAVRSVGQEAATDSGPGHHPPHYTHSGVTRAVRSVGHDAAAVGEPPLDSEAEYRLVADALRVARIDAAMVERRRQTGAEDAEKAVPVSHVRAPQALPSNIPSQIGRERQANDDGYDNLTDRTMRAHSVSDRAIRDRIATMPARISPGMAPSPAAIAAGGMLGAQRRDDASLDSVDRRPMAGEARHSGVVRRGNPPHELG